MIPLINYLMIGAILFGLGFVGIIINRNNLITLLMCVELMLLAVNTNFIAFAQYFKDPAGEIFVFFILTVAAVEAAIGLAILVLLYRRRNSISVQDINMLRG
jgi:NADH-quinone oxidoreductase subunit K